MNAWKAIVLALSLTACAGHLAERAALNACQYLDPITPEYADCYASAYQNERTRLSAVGAAMLGAGVNLQTAPVHQVPRPVTTTCYQQGYFLNCSTF